MKVAFVLRTRPGSREKTVNRVIGQKFSTFKNKNKMLLRRTLNWTAFVDKIYKKRLCFFFFQRRFGKNPSISLMKWGFPRSTSRHKHFLKFYRCMQIWSTVCLFVVKFHFVFKSLFLVATNSLQFFCLKIFPSISAISDALCCYVDNPDVFSTNAWLPWRPSKRSKKTRTSPPRFHVCRETFLAADNVGNSKTC